MGFIRLKQRKNASGTVVSYGYIVSPYWNTNLQSPRQKVLGYAGKVFVCDVVTDIRLLGYSFSDLLRRELLRHGFVFRDCMYTLGDLCVTETRVYSLCSGKKIVLQIHAGFLCDYTLAKLFSLHTPSDAKIFAKDLQLCGISVTPEEFVKVWENYTHG